MRRNFFHKLHRGTLTIAAAAVLFNVAIVTLNVILRYIFDIGIVALQELEWWSYSLIFLFGATATLIEDRHVRIDILLQRLPSTISRMLTKAGTLVFFFPFTIALLLSSLPFAWNAFLIRERSSDPGGMPAVYLLKAMLPLSFALLLIAGLKMLWNQMPALPQQQQKQ